MSLTKYCIIKVYVMNIKTFETEIVVDVLEPICGSYQ